jgi:hypothetical protein
LHRQHVLHGDHGLHGLLRFEHDHLEILLKDVANNSETTKTATYTITVSPPALPGPLPPGKVTAKCLECHSSQGTAVVNSLHGMMPTLSPNVTNATGFSQKLGEINTFCSYPNPDMAGAACLNCHPTLGKFENLAATDIDCLQCHNDSYKRRFIGETDPSKFINVVDWQGTPKTYVPAWKNANGNFQIEFNWAAMPVWQRFGTWGKETYHDHMLELSCKGKLAATESRGDIE